MKTPASRTAALAAALLVSLAMLEASAAELKVLSANAVQTIMEDLGARFQRARGHQLVFSFATLGELVKQVQAGESADVIVLPQQGMESIVKAGKAEAGKVIVLSRSSMGVAIRKGAARPDISTTEAFRRTLLAAGSITYSNPARGGTSGPHFVAVLERLGISEQMKPRTVLLPGGGLIGELVVNGRADIAVHEFQQLIQVPGLDIVGPLPPELQNTVVFAAVPMKASRNAEAAQALVDYLQTPEAAEVIRAKGHEPAGR